MLRKTRKKRKTKLPKGQEVKGGRVKKHPLIGETENAGGRL